MAGEHDWDEDVYLQLLTSERRSYAWVMERYGGLTSAEAKARAVAFYYYEAPDEECRGLVFHDQAWHWAMVHLHGYYWLNHPEWERPPAEYDALD
ncbi:hypothetical protein [Nocardia sp. NPDC057668]|uniref:hypothetical protein n=1 Tax=Nocardia sp. NPDC057668 TaxID=3346202 RepID=UPI00366B53B2